LLETWEDTSKELSKAMTGGLSLKEADALISKAKALGIEGFDLSKFVNTGDKLILTEKAFENYFKKLNEATNKNIEELGARLGDLKKLNIKSLMSSGISNAPQKYV
jgi:hypothetical protein